MKVVCYGASVTAQKDVGGYFSHIGRQFADLADIQLERITFGASQFEYAGYAFIKDVLAAGPKICLVDWLTPSMKSFSPFKIDLFNHLLLSSGCLPIWMSFPRVDNFDSPPEAHFQVKASAKKFLVPFLDLRPSLPDFSDLPDKYLRDSVHTNACGAEIYARDIVECVKSIHSDIESLIARAKESDGYMGFKRHSFVCPSILDVNCIVDSNNGIEVNVDHAGGRLEIFLESITGPGVCLLRFEVYRDSVLVEQETFNPADQWSHYDRRMVVETYRKNCSPGKYRFVISKERGDPFRNIKLRKPMQYVVEPDKSYIEIKRLSINGEHCQLTKLHGQTL